MPKVPGKIGRTAEQCDVTGILPNSRLQPFHPTKYLTYTYKDDIAEAIRPVSQFGGIVNNDDLLEYLPLSTTDFQLLLSLTNGELHGYAISKSVREASGGRVRIGLGSLYRIIARLLNSGLVEESESEETGAEDGQKRRKYCLTTLGRAVMRAEVNRLSDAVALARASQLFGE